MASYASSTDTRYITKVTTSGAFTQYAQASGVYVSDLTAGPDGAIWFLDGGSTEKVGRITTGTGSVTEYTIPGTGVTNLGGMTLGSDSAMWFTYYRTVSGTSTPGLGRLGY